jgi:hypothetical protein
MSDRPAFDPSVYESPELAELNRPIHALCWDMIEIERELDKARNARVSRDVYAPLEARYFAARDAHRAALDALDIAVAAYCDRIEAAGGLDAYLGRVDADVADQLDLAV